MCNIDKIINLAKSKGITQAHICKIMGERRTYLNEARVGKFSIPDDHVVVIAEVLGTTVEYLTDQTDDPTAPDDPQVGLLTKKALKEFEKLSDKDKETIVNLIESLSRTNGGK